MARPRSFDEYQVLEQCREVFCAYGYDATSIDDLVAATGLKRGSLYQAFGSKRGVFLKVLQSVLDCETESKAADESESRQDDNIPSHSTSPQNQSGSGRTAIQSEPQSPTNGLFSDNVLTLATIACLELAPHDAKIRDIIFKWRSQIPPEQVAILSRALGDNLFNRAGISTDSTTDSNNAV